MRHANEKYAETIDAAALANASNSNHPPRRDGYATCNYTREWNMKPTGICTDTQEACFHSCRDTRCAGIHVRRSR